MFPWLSSSHLELRIANCEFSKCETKSAIRDSQFEIPSVDVEPITREKQHAEDQERKEREHDRDRVRRLDLSFVEFRKDVERGCLGASREVAGDENRRAKLADRARERQQRSGN